MVAVGIGSVDVMVAIQMAWVTLTVMAMAEDGVLMIAATLARTTVVGAMEMTMAGCVVATSVPVGRYVMRVETDVVALMVEGEVKQREEGRAGKARVKAGKARVARVE